MKNKHIYLINHNVTEYNFILMGIWTAMGLIKSSSPNSNVEALTPNVTVFGDGAFGK